MKEGIAERGKLGQFELFGLDVIVDADQRVYLLEANRDPSWVIDTEVKKRILPDMVREMRLGPNLIRDLFEISWHTLKLGVCHGTLTMNNTAKYRTSHSHGFWVFFLGCGVPEP